MPKRGEYKPLTCQPGPQRDLAEAVRDLCAAIKLPASSPVQPQQDSLAGICRQLDQRGANPPLSKSVLSDLIHGKRGRRPTLEPLKSLHALACDYASRTGDPVISWDDLAKLCQSVRERTVSTFSALCANCSAPMLQGKPADSAAQNHNNIAPELPVVLPVPLLKGDRQHNEATDPPWPALQELTDRFATKRHEDAAGVLRHLGGQASAAETSLAIASCRRSGLHEAADAILHYASQRDVWAVMSLTKTLLNDQQQAAAGVLLDLALDS